MWLRPPSPVRLRDELCPSRHPTLYPSLRSCTGLPQEVARSLDGYSLPAARPRRGSFLPAVVQHPSSPRCAPSASTLSTSSEAGYHGSTARGQASLGSRSPERHHQPRRRIPSSETRGSTSFSHILLAEEEAARTRGSRRRRPRTSCTPSRSATTPRTPSLWTPASSTPPTPSLAAATRCANPFLLTFILLLVSFNNIAMHYSFYTLHKQNCLTDMKH